MRSRWQTLDHDPLPPPGDPQRPEAIFKTILAGRGLSDDQAIQSFLNPILPHQLRSTDLGLDPQQLGKAVARINQAKSKNEQIIIFGDFDCDGICATAILWEAIHSDHPNCLPYLPHRSREGFGLTKNGLVNLKNKHPTASLLITVDTGITNLEEVERAKELGFDVIVTDHHQAHQDRPQAEAVLHATSVSGSGLAWFLAKTIAPQTACSSLDLLTLATIGDLVPLVGPNRSIVYHGLQALNQTGRPGLKTLITKSGLINRPIGIYEVGHILVPRLNASGRLEHAMDSLRLLCTSSPKRATQIADHLESINQKRRALTEKALDQARTIIDSNNPPKLIFLADQTFHEGIIGLIAGRLVDEFSRPTIVVTKGDQISKGSGRSIPGFNLIEAFESIREHLIDGGGHPLAGGFTVKSTNLGVIEEKLLRMAQQLDHHSLQPTLKINLELELTDLSWDLLEKISLLKPFSIGNPAPVFALRSVPVSQVRWVGKEGQHLKFSIPHTSLSAIGFYLRDKAPPQINHQLSRLAFTLEEDTWKGNQSLLLKIKDLQ